MNHHLWKTACLAMTFFVLAGCARDSISKNTGAEEFMATARTTFQTDASSDAGSTQQDASPSTQPAVETGTDAPEPDDPPDTLPAENYIPGVAVTSALLPENDTFSEPRRHQIAYIMLHFMSNVKGNPLQPYRFEEIQALFLADGISTHYLIERDGTIRQLVREDRVAYHAGVGRYRDCPENKMNWYSIGIEMLAIGSRDEMRLYLTEQEYDRLDPTLLGYTRAQYQALDHLLDDLCQRHPAVLRDRTHIIGHRDWSPQKVDPGALFDWSAIGL